ncbi:MAG: PepSY domain-containing protein [Proteobacteria bacterium]|nr:PepSY domain-containing protein [Pseudomonadota bacterium]
MLLRSLSITLITVGLASATFASADPKPKVSLVEARKIALARVPGTIVHEKKKTKKHGHVIYDIEIKPTSAKVDKKLEIDASTGQIVKIKDAKLKAKDD